MIALDLKDIVVFAPVVSWLSVGIPAVVGVIAEKCLMKKENLKEKLREITSASNQQELIAEEVRCAVEAEKLFYKNKSLKNVYDKVVEEKNLLETLWGKYDVVEKSNKVDSKISLEQNIKNMSCELNSKEKALDCFVAKQILKDNFVPKKRDYKENEIALILMLVCVLNLPIIIMSGMNCQITGSLLNLISSFLVSVVGVALNSIKIKKDNKQVFEKLNKEYGESGLSEEEIADRSYRYEKEINQLLEDISILRLDLEYSKVKLESRAMLENTDEKDKKENYSYKFNDRQLNDDSLSQQKDFEKSAHLTRKKVKKDGC